MRKSFKVGIYTLISFVLLIFLIGAVTLNRKGGKVTEDNLESNIGNSITNLGDIGADFLRQDSDGSRSEDVVESMYNELQIKWSGDEIFITESADVDDISIFVVSGDNKRNIYSTNYITNKNKVIKINNKNLTENLEIVMPVNCIGENISVNAPGANVFLNGINTNCIEIKTDFGNVSAKDIIADSLKVTSESGMIYCINGKFITLEASSENGSISINSNADEFYLYSEKGNITFEPVTDWVRADIESEEGNIRLNLTPEYAHTIDVKPSDAQINISNNSGYEEANNKYIFKDGFADINIHCEKGIVYINKAE